MEFGKVEYRCERRGEKTRAFKTLTLTLVGLEDMRLLEKKGVRELRLSRIMRITHEAAEQGCLLSYEDLSALLLTSFATLKRDISHLAACGYEIPLKGRRKNRSACWQASIEREDVGKMMIAAAGETAGTAK